VGAAVTFIATVSPATATGPVQFLDGTTVLGTATLASGSASFTTSALTQGTHSITAVYGGDTADAGSTSAALSQSVKLLVGMNVGVSPSAPVAGQVVTLSATMNAAATGTVTFSDGSTALATVTVASGAASYSTSSLAAGVHLLGFSYTGDATYMSAGTSFHQTVLAASSIVLTSSANPSATGQSVTFTALVTPSAATGTVTFLDRGTVIGTATLVSGTAAFATSSLAAGAHSITASYSGDANDVPASSAAVAQTVKAVAAVSLTSSANPSTVGHAVTFTAGVTPSTATGTVQFLDGSSVIGTVAVTSGAAAFSTSQLTQGAHSITASYAGDANDTAATSATLTQTVNPPAPAAPSNLTATAAGASQIDLAWHASPTSGVTYNVYSSTASGFIPSASNRIASGVTATSYDATGLSPATKYYFRVTAVNAGGESAATNQATAMTKPH
jgi:large repetitive protein